MREPPQRFSEFHPLDPAERADLCLERREIVRPATRLLRQGKSVRLAAPDNCGKSTLLNLIKHSEENRKSPLFFWPLAIAKQGYLRNSKKLLRDSVSGLRQHLANRFAGPPAASVDNPDELAEFLRNRAGKNLCLIVDDLYRFDYDEFDQHWDRYPHTKRLLESISRSTTTQWLVTDNSCKDLAERLPGHFEEIAFDFFSDDECSKFFTKHFPHLFSAKGSSGLIFRATRGNPYQVVAIARHLADRQCQNLDEVWLVLEDYYASTDKTVLKVKDYAEARPEVKRLFVAFSKMKFGRGIPLASPDEEAAARYLTSTGAFCIDAENRVLQTTNPIFRRKLADRDGRIAGEEDAEIILSKDLADVPDVIGKLRREGVGQTLLAGYLHQRLSEHIGPEVVRTFLKSVVVLFDLKSVAFVMKSEDPLDHLLLYDSVTADGGPMDANADILAWVEGLPDNQWLQQVRQQPGIVVFRSPFGEEGRLLNGGATEVILDGPWKDTFSGSDAVLAVPFVSKSGEFDGILVADQDAPLLDDRDGHRLTRLCQEIAPTIRACYSQKNLDQISGRFHRAMHINTYCATATEVHKLYALTEVLRDYLGADYVDVCQATADGQFLRRAKAGSKELGGPLGPRFDSFACEFRRKATEIMLGTRLISQDPDESLVTPGLPDGHPALRTVVSRRCGVGVTVTRALLGGTPHHRIPSAVAKSARAIADTRATSLDEFRAQIQDALQPDEYTAYGVQILDCILDQHPPLGVLSVGFCQRRVLSSEDLALIDACAELAAEPLIRFQEGRQVYGLLQQPLQDAVNAPLKKALRGFVQAVAEYVGVKYCSVSLVHEVETEGKVKKFIKSEEYVGYLAGYNDKKYRFGHGRTGFVVEKNKIVREDFGKHGEPGPAYYFSREHGYDPIPKEDVDQFLKGSQCKEFVDPKDHANSVFFGIPLWVEPTGSSNRTSVGCIKFLHLPEEDPITQDKLLVCIEVARVLALYVELARRGEAAAKTEAETEAAARLLRDSLEKTKLRLRAVIHQLRTPLVTIALTLDAQRQTISKCNDSVRAALTDDNQSVRRECRELDAVVNYLQEFHKLAFNPERLDLAEWIRKYVADSQEKRAAPAVRCRVPSMEVLVTYDQNYLGWILDNLVLNSNEAGASSITIGLHPDDESVYVSVEDDGKGFCEEAIKDCYAPKLYADSLKRQGRGGGLPIVAGLVDSHNGECLKPIRQNGRTIFAFRLPRR